MPLDKLAVVQPKEDLSLCCCIHAAYMYIKQQINASYLCKKCTVAFFLIESLLIKERHWRRLNTEVL